MGLFDSHGWWRSVRKAFRGRRVETDGGVGGAKGDWGGDPKERGPLNMARTLAMMAMMPLCADAFLSLSAPASSFLANSPALRSQSLRASTLVQVNAIVS